MIGFLRGKVAALKVDYVLLDVHDVGYRVFIPNSTRSRLRLQEEAYLYTYISVNQDSITLYGFATEEEYDLFQLLIGVSGIGPKGALGILSATTIDSFCTAIQNKQTKILTKLPGIGKKSAERLILELKDKVAFAKTGGEEELFLDNMSPEVSDDMISETTAALAALGYSQSEIAPALKQCKAAKSTEEMIKLALKALSRL